MSIEGLNSLIQLESTRLEGAKSVTQNFQSVNSTVQQQGMQVAQSKSSMAMSRIDAEYTKEVAQADVRKLERKLARERGSEALTKSIAAVAFIGNAIGNFGHMINDLKGRQKLGETPDYLKTPSIDPNSPQTKIGITTAPPPSGANVIYASSGPRPDGTETVYSYKTGVDGVSTSDLPIAANISEYDKERILGDAYTQMKAKNGGNPLTFEQIRNEAPDLAERLVSTRGHGVHSDEAANLMKVMEANIAPSTSSTTNRPQAQAQGTVSGTQIAGVSAITSPSSETPKIQLSSGTSDADVSADATKLADAYELLPAAKKSSMGIPTDKNPIEFLSTRANQQAFVAKLNNAPTVVFNSGPNLINKKNEDVQITNYRLIPKSDTEPEKEMGLTFKVSDISAEDKAKVDPKYKNMTFAEIHADSPEKARLLVANVVKEQFDALDITKPDDAKKQTDIMLAMGITDPKQFTSQAFSNLMDSQPEKANSTVAAMGSSARLQPLTFAEAKTNVTVAAAANSLPALRESLGNHGKIDNRDIEKKITDTAKPIMNFLVNTVKESAPYFQAYLAAKNKADETQEELIAAKEKLDAANRRLKSIESQIDIFGGRGA